MYNETLLSPLCAVGKFMAARPRGQAVCELRLSYSYQKIQNRYQRIEIETFTVCKSVCCQRPAYRWNAVLQYRY